MCGIVGIFRFDGNEIDPKSLNDAVATLNKRGPDNQGIYIHRKIGLGHTRLAIIDPEPASNQPFHDSSGRYTLVFNGEIFNFRRLRNELEKTGIDFQTKSDTEVLMQLLIKEGTDGLHKLNGFFSFAFFDNQTQQLLLVRDRYGVKPLYVCQTDKYLVFGSEMKALVALGVPKEIDEASLLFYFQLNYIPSPNSIYKGVKKLSQSTWLKMDADGTTQTGQYYLLEIKEKQGNYEQKKNELKNLLSQSVQDRLVSDVPLGVFLSGGVDSSIVSLLAKRHYSGIHSFSIGFKDSDFYDESIFAEKVAKHIGLQHHTFYLSNQDMLENLDEMLAYVDEPFADSSAIAVYNLCKQTRQHVTVSLTGDGADEVFGGYNKHLAESKIRKKNLLNSILGAASPVFNHLPESRSGLWGNEIRKIKKYARSVSLSESERYWSWCSFNQEEEVAKMFSDTLRKKIYSTEYKERKEEKLQYFKSNPNLENVLASDLDMVLEGDMLVKTDRMSMANSLELRNPFLDPRVVDFAFSLNQNDKISENISKRILKDTFRPYLPFEVFARPKHGFEVPLQKWLRNELNSMIESHLSPLFVENQGIFNPIYISQLVKQLHSNTPGDIAQRIWGLLVFQIWWKSNMK